jgi:hypothetical protein
VVFGGWMLTILIDTVGQLVLKAAAFETKTNQGLKHWRFMGTRPWIWLGFFCYSSEFVVWLGVCFLKKNLIKIA